VLQAVAHCHTNGIVHRDIKPENFLLSDSSDQAVLQLTDFGLSAFHQDGQRLSDVVGTDYYMAPEVGLAALWSAMGSTAVWSAALWDAALQSAALWSAALWSALWSAAFGLLHGGLCCGLQCGLLYCGLMSAHVSLLFFQMPLMCSTF
jgi:serine/threonine protein kinase